MKKAIKITNLTKIYPNGKKANDNLNITVDEEEIVGIIGPNGAGKTTLIRQMLGLLKPTQGKIEIMDQDISCKPDIIKREVGYAPQLPLYFPSLTVEEVVELVLKLRGYRKKELKRKVIETLNATGLDKVRKFSGYQLSSGLKKLLLIAIALCQEPSIVILDEPTAMVDIVNRVRIWQMLSKLKNRSIFLASHNLNEVKVICNRVYILVSGKIVAEGSPEEISTLMKMPVEINFIPHDVRKVKQILSSKKIVFRENNSVFNVTFERLSAGIDFVKEVNDSAGLNYIHLESPSFEKTVIKIMEGNK